MDFIPTLRSQFEELRAASQARRERIEAAYREENSDLPPTLDRCGRYHAPCNGYVMPTSCMDVFRGCYDDHVFGAGEYLPVPLDDEDDFFGGFGGSFSVEYRQKTKAALADIEALMAIDRELGLRVTHGKTWEQDGRPVAIAYVSGIKKMVDRAVEVLALPVPPREEEPEVYMAAGRYQVEGELVHVKVDDGYYGLTYKMLVKTAEGAKLWGSLPSSVPTDYRGWISFSAQFEPGTNGMSWFKRPTKVSVDNS